MAGDWPWIFNVDQWGRESVTTKGKRLACYRLGDLGRERLQGWTPMRAGPGTRRCFRTDNVRHVHWVSRCSCVGQNPSLASSIVHGRWQMPIQNAYPNPNNDMDVAQGVGAGQAVYFVKSQGIKIYSPLRQPGLTCLCRFRLKDRPRHPSTTGRRPKSSKPTHQDDLQRRGQAMFTQNDNALAL
jgi:hypothetical protein